MKKKSNHHSDRLCSQYKVSQWDFFISKMNILMDFSLRPSSLRSNQKSNIFHLRKSMEMVGIISWWIKKKNFSIHFIKFFREYYTGDKVSPRLFYCLLTYLLKTFFFSFGESKFLTSFTTKKTKFWDSNFYPLLNNILEFFKFIWNRLVQRYVLILSKFIDDIFSKKFYIFFWFYFSNFINIIRRVSPIKKDNLISNFIT